MHKRHYILPLFFAVALGVYAQEQADTTDMFYGHVDLEAATVTGVTGRTRLSASPAPIKLVASGDLRGISASNIVAARATQPGVAQLTTGSGISKPIIRGLGFNRIVCMADGVRQEGQQWGGEHGLELDGQGIDRIEILKGPASLMYGSDAMAGVLIFHTNDVREEGAHGGSVDAEYQTNSGLWNYSLNYGGNHGGFVWDGRWSQKAAHAYKNKYDGYVPGSQFAEQAARAMLGLKKSWGHSLLRLSYYHLTPSIIEGERDEATGELEAPDGWRGTSYKRTLPFQHVHHYKTVWDDDIRLGAGRLQATLGYQQNQRKEFEDKADAYALYLKLHTLTYDARYVVPFEGDWKLSAGFGGMWQHALNYGEEELIPAHKLFDIGGFVTASKRVGAFNFSGGLRYDHRHLSADVADAADALPPTSVCRQSMPFAAGQKALNFSGLSASLGGVWNVQRGLNVRLNLARGYRAPNMAELASDGVHEGAVRYERGNATLKPEHSWQGDLGIDYVNAFVSLQAALFLNRIDNYIYLRRTTEVADALPVYEYSSGDARLWGFELGADVHPIHSLHILTTFSYVQAVQLHQPALTKYLPQTPAPRWTGELKWEITHDLVRLGASPLALQHAFAAVGVEVNLRQGHCYLLDGTETPTPSYTLLGFSVGTDVCWRGKKRVELTFIADNLLNRAYQSHLSRLKYADVNNLTGRTGVFNPGRNFSIKVGVVL